MTESGTAKACQLIAVVPASLHGEWADRFSSLVSGFRPAAIVLSEASSSAADIIAAAQAADIAVLLLDDVSAAAELRLPGVHLTMGSTEIAKARASLGTSAIIGATCALSRHEALLAAEEGADYVAFPFDALNPEPATDLSSWWSEVTEIPVALICEDGIPGGDVLRAARADFVLTWEKAQAGESLTAAALRGLAPASHESEARP